MEKKILTSTQKKILELLKREKKLNIFYLAGGTALAGFYFHHRLSDDLDFFTDKKFDKLIISSFIEKIKFFLKVSEVRYEKLYDRYQFFLKFKKEELKIEFTLYPFKSLEKNKLKKGIRIDSLRDIAANKLMAMLDRFDPKDFVDLFFLLRKRPLGDIKKDAEKKFNVKIDDIFLGGELAKVRRIEALPKMLKPLTIKELKSFFEKEARKLKPYIFLNEQIEAD